MFIFRLQLESVLVNVLGIFLIDFLRMVSRIFHLETKLVKRQDRDKYYFPSHLLDLFDRLELDEQHNGVDSVVMKPLNRANMNV